MTTNFTDDFNYTFADGSTFSGNSEGCELRNPTGDLVDFDDNDEGQVWWTTETGSPVHLAAVAAGLRPMVPGSAYHIGPFSAQLNAEIAAKNMELGTDRHLAVVERPDRTACDRCGADYAATGGWWVIVVNEYGAGWSGAPYNCHCS